MLAISKSGSKYLGVILVILSTFLNKAVFVGTIYVCKREKQTHGDHSWLASKRGLELGKWVERASQRTLRK